MTILLVEQMANQALAVADRAYILDTGKVTHSGRAKALLSDPRVRDAYLGKKKPATESSGLSYVKDAQRSTQLQ